MFFTFDGVDGVGKSTQIGLFAEWLRERGQNVLLCRDPGSTPLGEKLREILLTRTALAIHRRSEMLLYMAARAQLVEEVIRPALAAGLTVVSDRYLLANVVYQGHAGGLSVETIWSVGEAATGGLAPDLTFLLDMPAEAAAARMGREPDRMEAQGTDYLRRVREGFLLEAARLGERIAVIDAARSVSAVQAAVQAAALRVLAP